ncbi:proline-rich transmembrane protein 1-like [Sphaerodactylus townsendi]|uniref:proline-rich transmembrane protein 1-like n=1 Tax=Sphaerodactylus townsendi TaxID=933632 RepID=UPI00202679DE|nr:proline-rich transmembrane protein 1-like [Sphaerodactylus townsendi]
MDNQKYHGGPPSVPNPPPYSEKQPYDQQAYPAAVNPMQPPYHPYIPPYGTGPSQGAIIQSPQHTIFVSSVQPCNEPDHLVFSILTMIFCCLPLGIAALFFSIKTRDANHARNVTEAQRNSRMARNLAISAFGVGLAFLVAYIVFFVVLFSSYNN